jgi:hypothetical protein
MKWLMCDADFNMIMQQAEQYVSGKYWGKLTKQGYQPLWKQEKYVDINPYVEVPT